MLDVRASFQDLKLTYSNEMMLVKVRNKLLYGTDGKGSRKLKRGTKSCVIDETDKKFVPLSGHIA